MIALYLPVVRPAVLDRARALLAAWGPSAVVVSPLPAPLVPPARWIRLDDCEPHTWRSWVRAHHPELVVVDGSGRHARAVTGLGSTVAVVAQVDGEPDSEMGAAYSEVDLILAPWAEGAVADTWPARWQERTLHLGALGWQAASSLRRRVQEPQRSDDRWHCVVLSGTGAGPGPRERRAMMSGTPGWFWTFAPEHATVDDGPVWDALMRCTVVVCSPSSTNLAAVAAVRKPALLVVGQGSHGHAFLADAARRTAPVLVRDVWPGPDDWRPVLAELRRLDGTAWDAWSPGPGLNRLHAAAGGSADLPLSATPARV